MRAVLTVLGSGTSMGVPTIGCSCRVCTSDDPHDRRTRPSAMVEYDGHCVLIVTTPDFREIPPDSMAKLRNLDILFLDALRRNPHPTHSTVANSLRLVEELKPKRAFFTHISHDLHHEETNQALPAYVRLAHDGLKLEFDIA